MGEDKRVCRHARGAGRRKECCRNERLCFEGTARKGSCARNVSEEKSKNIDIQSQEEATTAVDVQT